MAQVEFSNVTIRYPGADKPSVSNLNLTIDDGEFLVLVGPSGCGKSTTLRALAGLENIESGTVSIGGEDVTHTDPKDRDIAMVFQTYALYPHYSVKKNLAFPLKLAKENSTVIDSKIDKAAQLLGLIEYLQRKPKDLSGGQRQRVAMGRAIVRTPQVFLMDEPLSNLDAKLRVQTRTQLADLQHRLGTTTVYVTHDQVEAMTMGDRVAILKDGELMQVATPAELYDRPANAFVAGFIGSPAMNLLAATHPDHGAVTVGIRPEHTRLVVAGHPVEPHELGVAAHIDVVEELGSATFVYAHRTDDPQVMVTCRLSGQPSPAPEQTVTLALDMRRAHFFDAENGQRIE
ncbi:ABC transporter ATP-binding protein [Corynebacterium mendelii]|uniref:Trehalose import ATP-binding protein SugC n=1 Tax=Corynebacterium mendelii TaxID=2765362 RepID=A0A939E2U1_9CORY|nr:ATP-binding cassette domain-containing protein [Corynebacterium mendelii]MBN9644487.1 ATP-binding cassette domain-containing protein [Corynebacterium mendelii]